MKSKMTRRGAHLANICPTTTDQETMVLLLCTHLLGGAIQRLGEKEREKPLFKEKMSIEKEKIRQRFTAETDLNDIAHQNVLKSPREPFLQPLIGSNLRSLVNCVLCTPQRSQHDLVQERFRMLNHCNRKMEVSS